MSSTDGKTGSRSFKKKAHRPWTPLLESTVKESELMAVDELIDFDLDASIDEAEFNFIDDDLDESENTQDYNQLQSKYTTIDPEIDNTQHEIKHAIKQTQILLGGFFQPQQLTTPSDSQNSRKINSLLSDLKNREKTISSLTNDLKISEALERAEQAELNKKAEEHGRISAENRMRQAVEQATVAAEQFHKAMDQANQAAIAQKEEESLRKQAEEHTKMAKIRANNAETALQHERLARIAAEEKMQQAVMDAEQATHYKQQLQFVGDQLRNMEAAKQAEETRRLNLEQQYNNLNNTFIEIENAHKTSAGKIYSLENSVKELSDKVANYEQKIAEISAQKDKLKTIVEGEQSLRKAAEKRMHEALIKAEQAEKARQAEEEQRKLIDERAKRAVAHASRTVMHLLNAPLGNEYGLQIPAEHPQKEKVKVRIQSPIEEDDYSF